MLNVSLTFLMLTSCSLSCTGPDVEPGQAQPVLGSEATAALKAKLSLYLDLSQERRNEYGFVDKCDSLLFSSLSYVGGSDVDIEAAEDDGRWYRRSEKECYDNETQGLPGPGSTSDISKDQYLGLLWATWYDKDRSTHRLERMIAYGKSVNWKVGRGPIGETYITLSLRNTIAQLLAARGGKKHKVMLSYPMSWPSGLRGYTAHLQVLHILLRKKVLGKISEKALSRIKEHYKRNPKNALFSYAYHCFGDRDFTEAASSLLYEKWFPANSLPTAKNRYTGYLWQRENDDDWSPAKGDKIHDGVDYIFVTKLILEGSP